MVQFNKFHIGELVHNLETNEDGKIVGFRDTVGIPEYEVIVTIGPSQQQGLSLTIWLETLIGPLTTASMNSSTNGSNFTS
jgi:hypothetical protein